MPAQVGFDPTFNPQTLPALLPNIPADQFPALVDTGASESCMGAPPPAAYSGQK